MTDTIENITPETVEDAETTAEVVEEAVVLETPAPEDPEAEAPKRQRKKIWDNPVGRWFYRNRWNLLIFFLPVAIMYIVYACFGVHPFGENSVLVLDLNGQYVSYYEALRDAIWGDGSLMYSWSRNLSGEMFGIFAYYLASPFMWIIILLPRTMMCGAIEIMELAKIGCCGLAFAYYLRKSKGANEYCQVIFSVSYALMTYIVVELMNPMWIDGMIWLPIILLGIERLVDHGKMLGFVLPLTIMFISHFYIGYMIGFFCALYFVYYIFSRPGHAIAPHWFKAGLKFAASAIIAVLGAAVVLIPTYYSLSLGKLDFSDPDFTPTTQFDIFEFISKLFSNSYDTVRPEGLPMIACGTVIIMLIPLFFLNRNISVKEKVANGSLMFAIFGSMYVSTIDIAWHGFQVPNWLPYRYSFTFSFMMIICAYRAFENLSGVSFREIVLTAFAWIVVLAYLNQQDYETFYLFETVWFGILCVVVFCILLFLMKKYPTRVMCIVLAVFICLEIFENSLYTVYSIDCDVVYSTYDSYQDYFIDGRSVVDQVEEYDDGLYRMESTFKRTVNDPIGMGYKGISHSSSTMNSAALELLDSLGFGVSGHYSKYTGATVLTDSLLGIKYLMYKPDEKSLSVDPKEINRQNYENWLEMPYEGYELIMTEEDTGTDISVYENPYALSIGYMSSYDILDLELDSDDPIKNQENLLQCLLGDRSIKVFSRIYSYTTDTYNVSTATTGDHIWYTTVVDGSDSYVEFTINVDSDNPIYAFFPTIYQRQCNMWIKADSWDVSNYAFLDYFFTSEYYSILDLGTYEDGETIHLRMTLANGEALFSAVLFYELDIEAMEVYLDELRENQWEIEEYTDTYLSGTVTADEDGILFTTIPYESGWTITVDGEEVEPVKVLDSLIGIEVSEGTHTVTMKFFPDYFKLGIAVSILGLSLILIIFIVEFKNGWLFKKILAKTK
ncbi:MAG: YfhO family protein [Ruminococcus sp.]|nr:YfhO family protein [Ruminococcus sp.]